MMLLMLCLLFVIKIVAVLAQGEDNCILYKYATVNTFRTEKSLSFSCYGIGADCEIYYAPPGTGCNGDLLTLIDTVPENETQDLTSDTDEGFELGGVFCSKYQIGVYYTAKPYNYITAHLPRATEAATAFRSGFVIGDGGIVTQCVVYALSLPANVRLVLDGDVQLLSIDPYSFQQFETPVSSIFASKISATVDSDNPVIVSCNGIGTNGLATLQPISLEPLVVNTGASDRVSVVISDCSTNALIEDFSKVNFIYVNEAGSPCKVTPSNLGDPNGMTAQENCVFYVEPLEEDVCVGMMLFTANGGLITMGLPESKFSTRFANSPDLDTVNLISFSETTCTGFFDSSSYLEVLGLTWLGGDLVGKVSLLSWVNPFFLFSRTECENPAFLVLSIDPARLPFLSGYQSEKLWQPYFNSICPTKPPSSSNARSLVTSWVVFFAAYCFCSS